MPRSTTTTARKRKTLESDTDSDVDPTDFFNESRATATPKAKAAPKPRAKPKPKAAPASEAMEVDAKKEYGFPASELPDVAPKKFNYAQHAMGKGSGGRAGLTNLPDGIPNCLEGLKFVVTGEFGDMTREQITDLIKSFGGQVTSAVSGKTSYLVVGDEPGSSKVKKAKTMKTLCLYEHDLIAMIRSSKHGEVAEAADSVETAQPAQAEEPEDDSELEIVSTLVPKAEPKAATSVAVPSPTVESKPAPVHEPAPAYAPASASASALAVESKSDSKPLAPAAEPRTEPAARLQLNTTPGSSAAVQSKLWTEKYKPTKLKDLCGHKTSAQEILKWLSWWASGTIPEKRAVLISGPPGIGKTTTAHLVAKLAGFDVLELNASETRSKSSLKELLGPAVGNRSVLEFDKRSLKRLEKQQDNEDDKDVLGSVSTSGAKKLLVIMDEVDG
ncbi:DNA replication factor C complex subunit Rfc1, partial [Kickxella alabastrina]